MFFFARSAEILSFLFFALRRCKPYYFSVRCAFCAAKTPRLAAELRYQILMHGQVDAAPQIAAHTGCIGGLRRLHFRYHPFLTGARGTPALCSATLGFSLGYGFMPTYLGTPYPTPSFNLLGPKQ